MEKKKARNKKAFLAVSAAVIGFTFVQSLPLNLEATETSISEMESISYSEQGKEKKVTYNLSSDDLVLDVAVASDEYFDRATALEMSDDYTMISINGDSFDNNDGMPTGYLYQNDKMRHIGKNQNSIGISNNNIVIGQPEINKGIKIGEDVINYDFLNEYGENHTKSVFTKDVGKIQLKQEMEFYLLESKQKLNVPSQEMVKVSKIDSKGEEFKVNDNQMVITFNNVETFKEDVQKLESMVGNEYHADSFLNITGEFEKAESIIGGGNILMKNGEKIEPTLIDNEIKNRSIIGTNENGDFFASVYENITQPELIAALDGKGYKDVIDMDSGGSSSLLVKDDSKQLQSKNNLSEGSLRLISNSIVLKKNNQKAPVIAQLNNENEEDIINNLIDDAEKNINLDEQKDKKFETPTSYLGNNLNVNMIRYSLISIISVLLLSLLFVIYKIVNQKRKFK